jgi:PAS domain S-box-containing protein
VTLSATTESDRDGGLFIVFDIEGRHLFASPALHAFTGEKAGSIVAASWLQLTHPDDLDYARSFCQTAFRERCSFAGWWRIRRRDGAFVWVMASGMPMASPISDAPTAFTVALDPLAQLDAFPRAGGVLGPERLGEAEPRSRLARIERLADIALMASALARETGEQDIAAAFDAPLERIGFRLAGLTEAPASTAASITMSTGYRRPPRPAGTLRRRLVAR